MHPKIFVGIAIGIFAIILGVIAISGESIVNEISQRGLTSQEGIQEIKPVKVVLEGISILEIDEKTATIELTLKATNPNTRAVIIPFIKYQLYSDDVRLAIGEIGQRPEGMVEGSNYFTLLPDNQTILKDKVIVQNTGTNPELWSSLQMGDVDWRVTGDVFFNLSSMTSGGENSASFELAP